MLRANFCAAFCDVAVADAVRLFQIFQSVFFVQRMHFKRRVVNEKTGADKVIMLVMISQDMTDVLAEKALNAFAKFLNALNILLGCLLYTSPSPRDATLSRMPSSA